MNLKINTLSLLFVLGIGLGIYAMATGKIIQGGLDVIQPDEKIEALDTVIPRKPFYPRDTTNPINLKLPPDLESGYNYDPNTNSYFSPIK